MDELAFILSLGVVRAALLASISGLVLWMISV
jgi:hypothetical protein